jgi:sn-glycerol 3-phosphate transport system substrate-binding protein
MTRIHVWLSEHQFPTYDGEPFLAPMRRIAAAFGARHPEYEVVVDGHDHQALPARVAEAVRAGGGPHLAEFYAGTEQLARDIVTPAGRPYFTGVEQALAGRAEVLGEPVLIDDLEPAARAFFSAGGRLLSVPSALTTPLLYVNMTLLRDAGITAVPRTWEDVSAAAAATAVTWPNHGWLFQQAVAQQNGLLADRENGHAGRSRTVDLVSAEMLAWVRWWRQLHTDGHFRASEHWGVAYELFAGGQVALTVSTSKLAHDFALAAAEAGFELAVAAPPHPGTTGSAGNLVSGHSLWLADIPDPAVRDGALAFTQFLINPENAAAWHRAAGFTPVTRAAADHLDRDGWYSRHPHQLVATRSLRAFRPSPATAGAMVGDLAGIQEALTAAMDDVLHHGHDPADRFARATGEAQRLLDTHNAAGAGPVPRTPARLAVY